MCEPCPQIVVGDFKSDMIDVSVVWKHIYLWLCNWEFVNFQIAPMPALTMTKLLNATAIVARYQFAHVSGKP